MAIINGTNLDDDGVASPFLEDVSADLNSTLNANWSSGDDVMYGGINNDTYNVNSLGDEANELAGQGTDTVVSRLFSYTLGANLENLTLDSFGLFGVPIAVNGTGNELDNVITGNSRWNTLTGLAGNDKLSGSSGNDTLDGGNGNDTLDGGTGLDSMTGGNNNDVYVVDNAGDVVSEFFLGGTDRVESSLTYTLGGWVENLTLTGSGAINGTGNGSANTIIGNGANNLLSGLGANDSMVGGAGLDTLDGGTGSDTMKGGSGNDRYIVDVATDVVTELAGEGTDTVVAAVTYTLTTNVEKLDQFAAIGNVNGTGNASNNTLTGNNSNNVLLGLEGNDTILASGGDDTLEGGLGADTLRGGSGNDHLRAVDNFGASDAAVDSFKFDTLLNGATNVDHIDWAEFVAGEVGTNDDQIMLDNNIFDALISSSAVTPDVGTLHTNYFKVGSGPTSIGNDLTDSVGIYYNTQDGGLYYNPTEGTAFDSVLFAVLEPGVVGRLTITAEEFTLY